MEARVCLQAPGGRQIHAWHCYLQVEYITGKELCEAHVEYVVGKEQRETHVEYVAGKELREAHVEGGQDDLGFGEH